jgi:hypothetical protein
MKVLRLALFCSAAIVAVSGGIYARPSGKVPSPPKIKSTRVLNINAWKIYTTNFGNFVSPQTGSGGFWRNPAHGYIYGAGLWIGAILSCGDTAVAVGYSPHNGASEFSPYPYSWDDPGIRVYLSTDPADLAVWPVTENGQKVIRSQQDSWCRYYDGNPLFTTSGDSVLNVMVEQFSYAWDYADNRDIVFFYFRVKNISGKTMKNVCLGPCADCDIGLEAGPGANDRTTFDYTRNLAIQFQTAPEPGWDKTGVVGFRYFESPLNNTGDTVRVLDNQFPHVIPPGQPLGLTAFKIFTLDQDPKTDGERYLMMSGINYWDLFPDAYDEWGAAEPGDKRFLMSSGPFILHNDSVVTTCIGVIGALDTAALKIVSDVAQLIYDNIFQLAVPPAAPGLTATPGDGRVYLSWDKAAETAIDTWWSAMPDSAAWHYYFRGTWRYLPDPARLLVDSFEIKTGPATLVRIARGDANPVGGTDTLAARYNKKQLYLPYDFQGYLIYRADSPEDLSRPDKRVSLGGLYRGSSGAGGYFFDKADGIQIVPATWQNAYYTVDSTYYLPAYDTIGTDRGLIYGLVDEGLANGRTYYYGVSAYDYQPYSCFTRQSRSSLASDPRANAVAAVPWKRPIGYLPPNVSVRVDGGSDSRGGGALDYLQGLAVISPDAVRRDSFKLRWGPMAKLYSGGVNYPVYRGFLYNAAGALLDSTKLTPGHKFLTNVYPYYNEVEFYGSPRDQLPFGGLAFQPFLSYKNVLAVVDTVKVTGSYPADSIFAQAYGPLNTTFAANANAWMWRGSDFEIRWTDSVGTVGTNPAGTILTARVWDITNNVEVPKEVGVTKANMTQSSWCFNPAATAGLSYADSLNLGRVGMYICGIQVYFNRRNGGTLRNMSTLWDVRPRTGDVWTVRSNGPGTPMEGGVVTFVTIKASQKTGLEASLLDKIKVVPNPYLVRANWDVSKNYPNIYFVNLPSKCTIRIYNLAGDLVRVLNHESTFDENNGTAKWDLLTSYDKRPASGVYIYQIDAPGIGTKIGKFAVIK